MAQARSSCRPDDPPEFPRAALSSDAWLSCAEPGELAPEVGIVTTLKGTAGIKQLKDLFQWASVDFRQVWHLCNDNVSREPGLLSSAFVSSN